MEEYILNIIKTCNRILYLDNTFRSPVTVFVMIEREWRERKVYLIRVMNQKISIEIENFRKH